MSGEVILHTIEREGSLRRAAWALGVDPTPPWSKRRQYEMRRRTQIITVNFVTTQVIFHHLILPLFPVHPVKYKGIGFVANSLKRPGFCLFFKNEW